MPPAEAEARYHAQLEEPAWRRDSNEMAPAIPGRFTSSSAITFDSLVSIG